MIQMNSRVFIADNTGAKSAEMIRRIGQNKKTADSFSITAVGKHDKMMYNKIT